MDDQIQYRTKHQTKHNKKRLTQDQVRILEANFTFNSKLDQSQKIHLSAELDVPPRQVAIWYQNRRARGKNQSLEVGHRALQMRLESVLRENARLKVEVERLKEEVNRMRGRSVFTSFNNSGGGGSCDEVRRSNLYALAGFVAPDGHEFFGSVIS